MTVYEKLLKVQVGLKAPKDKYNGFGKYNYRSCESILEAAKPLLDKNKATIVLYDELEALEGIYIKATARFVDTETGEEVLSTAFAREEANKKGMDAAQITGSTSSYARKYALCGLLLIDDNKDIDSMNNEPEEPAKPVAKPIAKQEKQVRTKSKDELLAELEGLGVTDFESVASYYKRPSVEALTLEDLQAAVASKKKNLAKQKKIGGSAALESLNLQKD